MNILETMKLDNGLDAYVQIVSKDKKVYLSFDGQGLSMGLWISQEEATQYAAMIKLAIHKASDESK